MINKLKCNFLILINLFTINACAGAPLNETWILKYSDTGYIEIEFSRNRTFKCSGHHSNDWYSNAEGTYHYQKETGEIFIEIKSGGFDWVYKHETDSTLKEYWGEIFFDYPLYFKIIESTSNSVKVIEYINSYHEDFPGSESLYEKNPIWEKNNGKHIFTGSDESRLVEKIYHKK